MKIILNEEAEDLPGEGLSIRAVLDHKHWSFPLIIARLNGEFVPREDYPSRMVGEGDRLELYHLVSGG